MHISRLLLFFSLLLLSGKFFAQGTVDPRAFPDSNFSWNEHHLYDDIEFNIYYTEDNTYYDGGDTLIDNKHYRKLMNISVFKDYDFINTIPYVELKSISNSKALYGCIYNDKINKKVIFREADTEIDLVLFDFNLKRKDTVTMNYFKDMSRYTMYVVYVDSIVDPKGINRKYFNFSYNLADTLTSGVWGYSTLVEGIGMTAGIERKTIELPFERSFFDLTCIKLNDSTNYYMFNAGTIESIDSCNFTKFQFMGVESSKANSIKIYPNPAENTIHFNINDDIEFIEIYNSNLTLIKSSKKLRNKIFDVSTLPSGIYFCKILSKGKYYSGKFLKK